MWRLCSELVRRNASNYSYTYPRKYLSSHDFQVLVRFHVCFYFLLLYLLAVDHTSFFADDVNQSEIKKWWKMCHWHKCERMCCQSIDTKAIFHFFNLFLSNPYNLYETNNTKKWNFFMSTIIGLEIFLKMASFLPVQHISYWSTRQWHRTSQVTHTKRNFVQVGLIRLETRTKWNEIRDCSMLEVKAESHSIITDHP